MENKKKFGTGAIIGVIVLAALSAAELIVNVVFTIQRYPVSAILFELVPYTFLFIAIAYYAAAGYKKPHGDLLRAVFLVFSFSCFGTIVSQVAFEGSVGTVSFVIFMGIVALLTAYTGGRLDKIKKNYTLLIIITLALLVKSILDYLALPVKSFLILLWVFSTFVLWLDIAFAYILRYKEHKEAGLADKK